MTALTPLPPPPPTSTGRTRNAKTSIRAYVGDIAAPIETVGRPGEYRIETGEGVHASTDVPRRSNHGEYQPPFYQVFGHQDLVADDGKLPAVVAPPSRQALLSFPQRIQLGEPPVHRGESELVRESNTGP